MVFLTEIKSRNGGVAGRGDGGGRVALFKGLFDQNGKGPVFGRAGGVEILTFKINVPYFNKRRGCHIIDSIYE